MKRLSIAGLMALVVFFAVAFAALRNATEVWASATFTVALVLIAVAPVCAFAGGGRARLAWAGFACVGWACLLVWLLRSPPSLALPPGVINVGGSRGGVGFGTPSATEPIPLPPLLTEWGLRRLQPAPGPIPRPAPPTSAAPPKGISMRSTTVAMTSGATITARLSPAATRRLQSMYFLQVLRSLEILLLGLVGAFLARLLASGGERPMPGDPGDSRPALPEGRIL